MSQSSSPTRAPSCWKAHVRLTEQVDLPTPPLPLATATRRLIPGTFPWLAQGLGAPAALGGPEGSLTSTCASFTSGNDFSVRSQSALSCSAICGLPEVN